MNLQDRVAIVTGGATGIGRQIAIEFAKAGAEVVIASRNEDHLSNTVKELNAQGRRALAVRTDVRVKNELDNLAQRTLETFGKIDILVNNAAMITPYTEFTQISEDHWDEVLEVNLRGYFFSTQAVVPHMMNRKYGKIINITSMAALGCITPGLAPYIISKVGIIGLTKVCAKEFGSYGINVNSIAVGRVPTEMMKTIERPQQYEEYMEYGKKSSVLGRLGLPEDIAHLAVFLASDKASFITGQIIHDDGGRIDRM